MWDFHSPTRESLYNLFIEPLAARSKGRRGKGAFGTYEELVASFTEVLTTRRVSEPMRALMSELVAEIIAAWRHEFCRMISLKLNSFFLMPTCDAFPAHLRRALARSQRDEGELGEPAAEEAVRRRDRLRAEVTALSGERASLQAIAGRLRRPASAAPAHRVLPSPRKGAPRRVMPAKAPR